MKHAELVRVVQGWLRERACKIVLAEASTMGTLEEPDVIGWGSALGDSTLVECKASRADFLADKKKPFRQKPDTGMGRRRFYAAPANLIRIDDLPLGWGLLEVLEAGPKRIRETVPCRPFGVWNLRAEVAFLSSALQRATEGWGQKAFGDVAQTAAPHPRLARSAARAARSISRESSAFDKAFPKIPVRPKA